MKVVGIVGSPRRGANTETLVDQVLAGSSQAGAQTQKFILNELRIRGCQGCDHCKEHGRCRLDDDMGQVLEALVEADGVVVGSPIYMGYLTAQTKLFLDRLYVFFQPGRKSPFPPGKRLALVYSQGGGDDRRTVEEVGRNLAGLLRMQLVGIVGGNGMNDPNAARSNPTLLKEAFRLGQALCTGSP